MQERVTPPRFLDAAYQNRLARSLRARTESKAFAAIKRLISIEPKVGLALSSRVIRSKVLLEQLLHEGLRTSNETTVRLWLQSLGRRLGIDPTLKVLERQDDPSRKIALRVLYWLPMVFKDDVTANRKIERLKRATVEGLP